MVCNRVLELWISYRDWNNLCINKKKTTLHKLTPRQKLQTKPKQYIEINKTSNNIKIDSHKSKSKKSKTIKK